MADPIITENVYPPIPIRQFDWAAYRDPEGSVGWGKTEAEAIAALRELEEDAS
jgi:predicted RNase H-like HicB family nuclease